jgi:hypothetical protein
LADMMEDGTYDEIYDSFPNCEDEEVKSCMVPGGRLTESA